MISNDGSYKVQNSFDKDNIAFQQQIALLSLVHFLLKPFNTRDRKGTHTIHNKLFYSDYTKH